MSAHGSPVDPAAEWLEADGLGGFASGTVSLVRTRRYHALLLAALAAPDDRSLLVNGAAVWLERDGERVGLTPQRYAENVMSPDPGQCALLESFTTSPWPTWRFRVGDDLIEHQLFARHGLPLVALSWRATGARPWALIVRPLISGRDPHALHYENRAIRTGAKIKNDRVAWRPYDERPGILALSNGAYDHEPDWYRRFQYDEERERGLDYVEDLLSPGTFRFEPGGEEAVLLLAADTPEVRALLDRASATALLGRLREDERRRRHFPSRLHRAADAYIVRRGQGRTVIAGYPWFADWGRDTFIALRGLCIAGGRLDDAREILVAWAGLVFEGMLPNRFLAGGTPEYTSVDAALWFVIAVHDLFEKVDLTRDPALARDRERLLGAVSAILEGYARGTRHGIRMTDDALLACGEPGDQLTWMDARVGDRAITPRIGKPVEVQALWLNALRIGAMWEPRWREPIARGIAAFDQRFWNAGRGWFNDVVDVDHEAGRIDDSLRPNQLLAIGGIPFPLLEDDRLRRVVEVVERRLWTPLGPRTLDPDDPAYHPHDVGGPEARDAAYHQGTVWPWLAGAFVDAWLRAHGDSEAMRFVARDRFLAPFLRHLDIAGLDHVSEITDAEPPFTPRGCPFQAWSVGELMRMHQYVLGEPKW
jgi:predicted glycogen debranching enzyme